MGDGLSNNECPLCGYDVADTGVICHKCTDTTRTRLIRLAQRWPTMAHTVYRTDRIGDPARCTGEAPLPFSWIASDRRDAISNVITTWAREIAEQRGVQIPTHTSDFLDVGPTCQQPTNGRALDCGHTSCRRILSTVRELPTEITAALWITLHLDWLRHREYAEEAFDELTDATFLLDRAIDRPAPREFVGACPGCTERLYASPGKNVVQCPTCGVQVDAQDQRNAMLDVADDQIADAATIAAALTSLGEPIKVKSIYNWAHRGRLLPSAHDERGRPMYVVAHVRQLVNEAESRTIERARRAKTRRTVVA